jgi:hypothetical protein
MNKRYRLLDFYGTIASGADLWHFFLSDKNLRNNRSLSLFADFLRMWAGSCTWLGVTSLPYGAVLAARLQREIFQRLGQFGNMFRANSLISHTSYVQARIFQTRIRNIKLSILRAGNKSSKDRLKKELLEIEKKSRKSLKAALFHNELYTVCGDPPPFYNYGAYIHEALGNYESAEAGFKDLTAFYDLSKNEIALLDVLADAGSSKVARAVRANLPELRNEGIKQLQESYEKSRKIYFPTPHFIMIGKEFAKRLITIGDAKNAKTLLKDLFSEAMKRNLLQQATVIRSLQEEAAFLLEKNNYCKD